MQKNERTWLQSTVRDAFDCLKIDSFFLHELALHTASYGSCDVIIPVCFFLSFSLCFFLIFFSQFFFCFYFNC